MKTSELIQLLQTFPPDAEVIIELLDGDTSVPIQGAIQYNDSSQPETVHLVTRIINLG